MCGIVGSINNETSNEIVLKGLEKLEYRGYDSCGIAFINNNELQITKSTNKIEHLKKIIITKSDLSFGHTRWATHGKPSEVNAHPHQSYDGKITLCHNGVIENYKQIINDYLNNIELTSQTDSEVIAHLIAILYKTSKSMKKTLKKLYQILEGSFSLIIYNNDYKSTLFAVKHKSPLLFAKKDSFYTLSSDSYAVEEFMDSYYDLNDGDILILNNEYQLFDQNLESSNINFKKIEYDPQNVSKGDYDTYMLKEIEQQPKIIEKLITVYENYNWNLTMLNLIKNSTEIVIIGCGTSFNAGLIIKEHIQNHLKIATNVYIASEYAYENHIHSSKTVFIFISQSGETADSLLVLNKIKDKFTIISLTNKANSQIEKQSDYNLKLYAGIEISVASTKAYTAQITLGIILVNVIINNQNIFKSLANLIEIQNQIIADKDKFNELAKKIYKTNSLFMLGRNTDYYTSLEAALKIKEITYINVNAYPSGELKHGPISLIDNDSFIISLITQNQTNLISRSNLQEVKSRGAEVFVISSLNTKDDEDYYTINYDNSDNLCSILSIIPNQYLSLFICQLLKLNVDKPRNLAKSVTVE